LFSPAAFAKYRPLVKKPAFEVSPVADTYQPGAEITLTSTAKNKMHKGLSFFLSDQLLTPAPVDALSVTITIPSDIPIGIYTLRVASDKRATKTLFSPSITIATPTPQPVVNGKISFESDRDGNSEIYIMNADGSGQMNLSNNAASDFSPVFSPDGSKIAFRSNRDGNWEVYIVNTDGSDQMNISNNEAFDGAPVWARSTVSF
jgi:hypothetical protein